MGEISIEALYGMFFYLSKTQSFTSEEKVLQNYRRTSASGILLGY